MSPAPLVLDRPLPGPMTLLSQGVPLSLLLDLALGPHSQDLLRHEGTPVLVPVVVGGRSLPAPAPTS